MWCKKCKIYKSGAEHTVMHGGPLCRVCHTAREAKGFRADDERWFQSQPMHWRHSVWAIRSRMLAVEETGVPDTSGRQSEA